MNLGVQNTFLDTVWGPNARSHKHYAAAAALSGPVLLSLMQHARWYAWEWLSGLWYQTRSRQHQPKSWHDSPGLIEVSNRISQNLTSADSSEGNKYFSMSYGNKWTTKRIIEGENHWNPAHPWPTCSTALTLLDNRFSTSHVVQGAGKSMGPRAKPEPNR